MKVADFKVTGFLFSGMAAGIKKDRKRDLALIYSEVPARVAGLFTSNAVKAAPVLLDMERVRGGRCQAVLINSGNANACTGRQGVSDARRTSSLVSRALGIDPRLVLVSSTGVIGVPLPVKKIEKGIPALVGTLSPDGWTKAVEAIMTTDTVPKAASAACRIRGKRVKLCGMVKGAGMIRPHVATMLSFLVTDANIRAPMLRQMLRDAAEGSYNRITIDGDMSTNDTVLLLANGTAGHPSIDGPGRASRMFQSMLAELCEELAKEVVKHGEGVTKFIEVVVRHARSRDDAKRAAYAIAHSPLVKTAFFGEDANWGRILCALGHSGAEVNPNRIDLYFDTAPLVRNGLSVGARLEKKAARVIRKNTFKVTVDLHQGQGEFSLFTSDLSFDYVKVNASYRS